MVPATASSLLILNMQHFAQLGTCPISMSHLVLSPFWCPNSIPRFYAYRYQQGRSAFWTRSAICLVLETIARELAAAPITTRELTAAGNI